MIGNAPGGGNGWTGSLCPCHVGGGFGASFFSPAGPSSMIGVPMTGGAGGASPIPGGGTGRSRDDPTRYQPSGGNGAADGPAGMVGGSSSGAAGGAATGTEAGTATGAGSGEVGSSRA